MTRSTPSALSTRSYSPSLVTVLFLLLTAHVCKGAYYGKLIGKLSELHHGVSGEVYAVDGRTLYIKDLTYDGEGPAAWFYVGNGKTPDGNGIKVRDERGTTNVLKRYRKKSITLTLPEGKTLNNIKWFYLWCEDFSVNFGDVKIPRGFDYPRPQKLESLSGIHRVSSDPVVIVDAQTLLIPNFNYDGEAPDVKFWVGAGPTPSPQGIRVPDENGKQEPLRKYDHKTIVLTLPGDLTIQQLGHFGVWCEAFTVDFGHVKIPRSLNVPPSLKMLGISPQSKLNCEVLEDSLAFEVRWAVAGDSVVVQLVAKLSVGQYMSFGLSANPERSDMVGGDVVVAWVDKQTLQGYAIDYILDAKSQCSGNRGSCPDTRLQENTNSVRLLNAAMVNGYSIVTYQRPLKASDELDREIITNGSQAIIWAIGPLNDRNEVSFHSNYLKTDRFIEFGRPPAWNCPMPDQDIKNVGDNDERESDQELSTATKRGQHGQLVTPAPASRNYAWEIPPIECWEPDDGQFFAQMGPTGGKHGYPAITGHIGWGVSWYINGLLIPEINVVRGKNYVFVTEGGDNPEYPALYHPFYITDDPVGGYQHKTPEERSKVKIFAGVKNQRGTIVPTGVGRLCNWIHDQNQPEADTFSTFGGFQRTLALKCENGEPGFIQWTPDKNTPDTVYYQCFTHRYMGWKINVLDSCDNPEAAGSENQEYYADLENKTIAESDLEGDASIRVSSKVTAAPEYFQRKPESNPEYGLRPHHRHHYHHRHYSSHYPKTNHGQLGPHNMQLTRTYAPNNLRDAYERMQAEEHKMSHNPSVIEQLYAHREEARMPLTQIHGDNQMPNESGKIPHAYSVHPVSELESSSNQLSKLIPDPRPATIMNYAMMNVPSPIHGLTPQILYSKSPQQQISYQTPPRPQMMILRKTVRRPTILPTSLLNLANPAMKALSQFPSMFNMERKKAMYVPPVMKPMQRKQNTAISKLMKIEGEPHSAETKVVPSDVVIPRHIYNVPSHFAKQKKRSGFDPNSIVVEGGFKPIIRDIDEEVNVDSPQREVGQKREQKFLDGLENPEAARDMEIESSEYSSLFYMSPPADTSVGFSDKKMRNKNPLKSVSKVKKMPSRTSSDRTPRFGIYHGEMPPAVGGNFQFERLKAEKNHENRDSSAKAPLIGRSKRSSGPEESSTTESWDFGKDHTARAYDHNGHTNYHIEHMPDYEHDYDHGQDHNPSSETHEDHESHTLANAGQIIHDHHHPSNETHEEHGNYTLANAGKIIATNMEYIILTIILYYVI